MGYLSKERKIKSGNAVEHTVVKPRKSRKYAVQSVVHWISSRYSAVRTIAQLRIIYRRAGRLIAGIEGTVQNTSRVVAKN